MKIAAYVDAEGEIARVSDKGAILLFELSGEVWKVRKTIRFGLRPDDGLAEIHASLAAMVPELEDCRLFLSRSVRGVVNSLLQEMGIQTWQSHGPLFTQLETIARKENERAQQAAKDARAERRRTRRRRHHLDGSDLDDIRPVLVGDEHSGHFRLDLVRLLQDDPWLNSWDILIPFLAGTPFRQLDLVCDHIPRWFSRAMRALAMDAEIMELPGLGVAAIITPKQQAEAT
ncbi:Fe-only nitrogenase accessory protein AnfO [Rhodopseudomonas sp. AAP120]|uniref:Fe-only nitrogenase accessory protein AnfO n=1 Tax=Rhodopseudomonas sp. AAP120 TaxID=1523430 RepID=UPI0006B9975C|nr:Fe-only nitrogenase accessory protein AnfO [Rhodopseudomonas sp. AAP120]KPF94289.1 Fe-only nitrogenase accessory protein AnfO [Rhodopseudomonas sp. AAP120]